MKKINVNNCDNVLVEAVSVSAHIEDLNFYIYVSSVFILRHCATFYNQFYFSLSLSFFLSSFQNEWIRLANQKKWHCTLPNVNLTETNKTGIKKYNHNNRVKKLQSVIEIACK